MIPFESARGERRSLPIYRRSRWTLLFGGLALASTRGSRPSAPCSTNELTGSATKIVGYQISEQILVTVRDLDKAGDVVDAAAANGANNVNGISFESGDPVKAQNDARAAAVAAARTSAQAMAAAGNVSLGAVISITDASPISPIWYGAARAGALNDLATPVEPGTQDLTATVTVVFEIS